MIVDGTLQLINNSNSYAQNAAPNVGGDGHRHDTAKIANSRLLSSAVIFLLLGFNLKNERSQHYPRPTLFISFRLISLPNLFASLGGRVRRLACSVTPLFWANERCDVALCDGSALQMQAQIRACIISRKVKSTLAEFASSSASIVHRLHTWRSLVSGSSGPGPICRFSLFLFHFVRSSGASATRSAS